MKKDINKTLKPELKNKTIAKVTYIFSTYRPLNAYPNQSSISFGGNDASVSLDQNSEQSLLNAWKKTYENKRVSDR